MNFNLNNVPTNGTTINSTEAVETTKEINNEAEPLKIVPIAGYDGDYWISNFGQVFSSKRGEMLELKPNLDNNGYYVVSLSKNGKKKKFLVHRLVNLHYNVNPLRYNITDHIDGNKLNNRASNLRWCTQKENLYNPNSNLVRPVARFTLDGKYIDERASIQTYQDEFGFNRGNIVSCCKGKRKSAYGYKWMYIDKQGYLENF